MANVTSIPLTVDRADLTADQIVERTWVRELQLSRLLMPYILSGLLFMLLPGTFLGVWNLISISGRRGAENISPAWIQAHGHAQAMGWIGSFIIGICYYSIPKLRHGSRPFALDTAWFARRLVVASFFRGVGIAGGNLIRSEFNSDFRTEASLTRSLRADTECQSGRRDW